MDQANLTPQNIQTIKIKGNKIKIKSFYTHLNKKLLFVLGVLFMFIVIGLTYAFLFNNKESKTKGKGNASLFTLDKINFSEYPKVSSNDIIYSKSGGNYLLNLNTKKKILLYSNKNTDKTARYFFSPAKNYVIFYKMKVVGNATIAETSLKIYDRNLNNPQVIYDEIKKTLQDNYLEEPNGEFISNSGRKLILILSRPNFISETETQGGIKTMYLIDLPNKTYKILDTANVAGGRVIGWSKDDEKVLIDFGSLTEYNLKNNSKKYITTNGDAYPELFDKENYYYIYNSQPLIKNDRGYSEVLTIQILNLNNNKEIVVDQIEPKINYYPSFYPLKMSKDGKKLLYKLVNSYVDSVSKKENKLTSYVLFNLEAKKKQYYNQPEPVIAELNKEEFGLSWYAACKNMNNFIKINGEIFDSSSGFPNNPCGQLKPIYPFLFTTDMGL